MMRSFKGEDMTDRSALERRLTELREALGRVEGTQTEVYSRIVGYYRSVRNWNAGKREEYAARRMFEFPPAASALAGESAKEPECETGTRPARTAPARMIVPAPGDLIVFTRAACPNCPPVANFIRDAGIPASFIDVDRSEGLELARQYGVLATPTVIALDAEGEERFRACDVGSLRKLIGAAGREARSPETCSAV